MEVVVQSVQAIIIGLLAMLVIASVVILVLPQGKVEAYKQIVVALVGKVPSVNLSIEDANGAKTK